MARVRLRRMARTTMATGTRPVNIVEGNGEGIIGRDRDRGNEEPVGRATMVRPMNVTADTGINRAHVLWTKSGEGAETRSDAMSHLGNPTGGMVIGMSRDEPRDDRTTMTILQDIMTTRDDTATNTTTKAGAEAGVGADRLTDQRID